MNRQAITDRPPHKTPPTYRPSKEILHRSEKTPENLSYLVDRLPQVIRPRGLTYNAFLDQVDDFKKNILPHARIPKEYQLPEFHKRTLNESRLCRVIKNKDASSNITPDDFRLVVLYLDYKEQFLTTHRGQEIAKEFSDPLFPSLLDFMDIGEYTLNNMKARAPGLYRAYRPASTFPGNFWVGALEIAINEESGALATTEFYQSDEFDGRPNKTIQFFGYLVRKGRHYTILSRNDGAASLSIAFLPSVMVEDGRITNMTGAVLDMSTGHLWGGRIIYDRIAPDEETPYEKQREQLFSDTRVCPPEDIPQSIAHHFHNDPIPNLRMF